MTSDLQLLHVHMRRERGREGHRDSQKEPKGKVEEDEEVGGIQKKSGKER